MTAVKMINHNEYTRLTSIENVQLGVYNDVASNLSDMVLVHEFTRDGLNRELAVMYGSQIYHIQDYAPPTDINAENQSQSPTGYLNFIHEVSSTIVVEDIAKIIDASNLIVELKQIDQPQYDMILADWNNLFVKKETDGAMILYEYFHKKPTGNDNQRSSVVINLQGDYFLIEEFGDSRDADSFIDYSGTGVESLNLLRTNYPIHPSIRSALKRSIRNQTVAAA